MSRAIQLLVVALVWWAVQGRPGVAVWQSDLTLWRYAVTQDAPGTVRAQRNYAKAVFASGDHGHGRVLFAAVDPR